MANVTVAMLDAAGKIGMIVFCDERDVELQNARGLTPRVLTEAEALVVQQGTHEFDSATGEFKQVKTDLDQAKDQQKQILSRGAAIDIYSGFTSSAMGEALFYPSDPQDQTNMVQASLTGGLLYARDSNDVWSLIKHSAGQAAAVLADFVAAKDLRRQALADSIDQVDAAIKEEDLAAIEVSTKTKGEVKP